MQGNNWYEHGKVCLSTLIEKDYVETSVGGDEVYMATSKTDGNVKLLGFESRFAANRYMSISKDFFYSKIIKIVVA